MTSPALPQPLLTVAIPTFNRAPFLRALLHVVLPQLATVPAGQLELLISDNSSTDETPELIAEFQQSGLVCRYIRNEVNIGSDANFLQCLREASGKYFWLLGDDDLLTPDALPHLIDLLSQGEYDVAYLSSFAFSEALPATLPSDKLGRYAEHVTDGEYFLEKVNALIGLISVVIINRNKLLDTPHPAIDSLNGSNLMQAGWIFPLVHERMSVLYVWHRLLAYRQFNSGGWGICEVFGIRLNEIACRYFAAEPQLASALMNGVLRYWLFDSIVQMRHGLHAEMNAENFARDIRHVFHNNWRYWFFIWPVAELPVPLATAYHRVMSAFNKLTRAAQALLRHTFRRGVYLQPRPTPRA